MRTTLAPTLALLAAVVTLPSQPAHAQVWDRLTNSRSSFTVEYPPQVLLAGVTKISVLEFTGSSSCGPELTERLTQQLGNSNRFEVIDRASLSAVLREQDFQASGAVTPEAQVRLGEMLGPAALMSGRITRCVFTQPDITYRDVRDREGRTHRQYFARSVGSITVSVALIDLMTGKRHVGTMISETDTLTNQAVGARPEYPSLDVVRTRLLQRVTEEAAGVLFPTYRTVQVVLYDDNACDLKRSADQIKLSNFVGAAATLEASIARSCDKPNDKNLLAKAYYNLGVAHTYGGHHEEALRALDTSAGLRMTDITREAVRAVQTLMAAEAERIRAEEHAVVVGAPSASPAAALPANALTNAHVIDLVRAELSDQVIIAQIRSLPCRYDTSPPALIALKRAGVSDALILEMTDAALNRCR